MSDQTGRYSEKPTGGRPPYPGWVENGRVPLSMLRRVEAESLTFFLYPPCARGYDAMHAAAAQDGVNLDLSSAYRDYAGQVYQKRVWTARGKPGYAADPGTSNHGWGNTIDHKYRNAGALDWMKRRAIEFGFDHPRWADDGVGVEEDWHWQWIAGFKLSAEITVALKGQTLPGAEAVNKAGRIWVEARPVVEAMEGLILSSRAKQLLVSATPSHSDWLPFENRGGEGYVPARDLANLFRLDVAFDGERQVLRFGVGT